MLEGVRILDFDFRYIYVNNACAKQSRLPKEELLGRTLMENFPGFEETELFETFRQCMTGRVSKHLETEFVFPDHTKSWFELSIQPIPEGLFVLSIDITARKNAEKEIIFQKKFMEEILNNLPADIAVFDPGYRYIFLNPNAVADSETRQWLIGKTDLDYFRRKGMGDLPALKRKALFEKARQTRSDIEWTDEYSGPAGTKYMLRKIHPLFEEGGLKYMIGYGVDITGSKRTATELSKALAELQNAHKELQQFAYMVSHDLQEPLRMVSGFLNLLKADAGEQLSDDAKTYIQYAWDGANRMKNMIEDLLHYSRVGTAKEDFTDVDVNGIVEYVMHVLKKRVQDTNAIVNIGPLPVVKGIRTLLSQLFLNLVGNALKYHGAERPEIEISSREDADKWLFFIKDNGIGIEEKYFDRIFVIFQRLHARNEFPGTGVGLAICKRIVEKHGGSIWVESKPGKGSTFYFTLPKPIHHATT
jgi:PAS domain S-box-containing protein